MFDCFLSWGGRRSIDRLVPAIFVDNSSISRKGNALTALSTSFPTIFCDQHDESSIKQHYLDECIGYWLSFDDISHWAISTIGARPDQITSPSTCSTSRIIVDLRALFNLEYTALNESLRVVPTAFAICNCRVLVCSVKQVSTIASTSVFPWHQNWPMCTHSRFSCQLIAWKRILTAAVAYFR